VAGDGRIAEVLLFWKIDEEKGPFFDGFHNLVIAVFWE
jgi:hypothetical protein